MCTIACVAVFALLTFLAITMHFITSLFQIRGASVDAAIAAAISGAVASVLPGARVTHIEEER